MRRLLAVVSFAVISGPVAAQTVDSRGAADLADTLSRYVSRAAFDLGVVKVGVDGKDVGPMVHAGKIQEVRDYCLCDVAQTAGVFLRLQLVRGEIDRERYLAGMTSLLTAIKDNPKLAPVAAALNEDRLLLREAGSPPAPAPVVPVPVAAVEEGVPT